MYSTTAISSCERVCQTRSAISSVLKLSTNDSASAAASCRPSALMTTVAGSLTPEGPDALVGLDDRQFSWEIGQTCQLSPKTEHRRRKLTSLRPPPPARRQESSSWVGRTLRAGVIVRGARL
jgi:hypothetical protein